MRPRVAAGGAVHPLQRENQILALILKVGYDIPEISRRSGIPVETVRHLYREHIRKRRIRVRRELDHYKLGLKHIQFVVTPEKDLKPLLYNPALGTSLWEELYVNSVYRSIPEDLYFVDHLAPPSLHSSLTDLYGELEGLGAVRVHEVREVSRLTHPRMWVEDYDWDLHGWDFDWSSASTGPIRKVEDPPESPRVKFDKTDLLLIMKLQVDYDKSITTVAAENSISRSMASWHFRRHLEAQGIFGDYIINWMGTTRETKTGYAPKQHQSFASLMFSANGLSSVEMMYVRARLHSIPYLWSETVGASDYFASTLIPLYSLIDAFRFFSKILRSLDGRARVFTIDHVGSTSFTIHPELFDEESDQWVYRGDLVLGEIKRTLSAGTPSSGQRKASRRAPA